MKYKAIVLVNDEDAVKYLKMFRFMLGDKVIKLRNAHYDKLVETDDFIVEILTIGYNNLRGYRADWVMDLTKRNDVELSQEISNITKYAKV